VALAAYDLVQGSTHPDVEMTARSGSSKLLEYEAKGEAPPPMAVSVPWESLSRPPEPLRFEAAGTGQLSITASLSFVPASVPTKGAIYQGLFVEKVVRKMDPSTGKGTGPALHVVQLGDSVVVTIQVTSPDDTARVMLQDPAAGGLEPVDPNVAGDEAGNDLGSDGSCKFGWSWWCVPSFSNRETYADRVAWSSWETLPAGTHTVSYQATAVTRGIFVLPPAHAYVENQPELMGVSRAGTIVVAGGGMSVTDMAKGGLGALEIPDSRNSSAVVSFLRKINVDPPTASAVAKGCDGGCPNGGVCQLDSGRCACYQGVSFVDGDCPKDSGAIESFEKLFTQGAEASEETSVLHGASPSTLLLMISTAAASIAMMFFAFRVRKPASTLALDGGAPYMACSAEMVGLGPSSNFMSAE